MEYERIGTSYDLADLLEKAAKLLRGLPEMRLTREREWPHAITGDQERNRLKHIGGPNQNVVANLAEELSALDRRQAESRIAALSVPEIRQLGFAVSGKDS